jgi:TonB family protein
MAAIAILALIALAPAPASRATPARAALTSYFSDDDYPASAMRAEEEGNVSFNLTISREGTVSDCVITSSSGSAALDETTCRVLRERARYTPAMDARGHAVAGSDNGRVTWRLPPAPPPPPPSSEGQERAEGRGRANLTSYFSDDDYPAAALAGGQEGTVAFRLTISREGRVSDCVVTATSGSPLLDDTTCRILRSRARYAPARDAAGLATEGSDAGRVTWQLPAEIQPSPPSANGPPPPPVRARPLWHGPLIRDEDYPENAANHRLQGNARYFVVINAAGRVSHCRIVRSTGWTILDEMICRVVIQRARFEPARDAAGAPAVDTGIGLASFQIDEPIQSGF